MTGTTEGVRYGLLVGTCLEVLRDSGERMPSKEVLDEVARRIELTEAELRPYQTGVPAWVVAARFKTGEAATVDWMAKRDGLWEITEKGRTALEIFSNWGPEALYAEVGRQCRTINGRRKQARKKYESKLHTIATALELVPAGS